MVESGGASTAVEFPIRLQRGLRPILLLFGVRAGKATVRIDAERLTAQFGFFRAETPLTNITRWDITGPYRWWRAVGVRRTLGTHDLSFGGSAHGGLCLHFRRPVRVRPLRVRDLYLTVDDLAGLGAVLSARGISGLDLRTRR
jgi:hypothetical protein